MVRVAGFQPDRSRMASVFLCAIRVFALTFAVTATVSPASAQETDRSGNFLDRIFGGSERFGGNERTPAPTAQAVQERGAAPGSDIMLRLDRLEAQIRQLTGTVEQLQFRNQQLEQYVRRMQEEGASRPTPTRPQAASSPLPPTGTAAPGRRGDAFDPAQHPNAPGAPRALGSMPAGAPPGVGVDPYEASTGGPPSGQMPPRNPHATGPQVATLPPSQTPKDEYDLAYGYMLRKEYALAEEGFRTFLKKHPNDPMLGDATYWLGESLFQRQRFRDAAEAFLNVSTKFETNARAPDALLRLGQSLAALGEKEAACASLGEVARKFPRASMSLKQSVEREQKRVRC
jgi:tol-pal system protein YbgF